MDLWIADMDGVFTDLEARPNAEAIRLSAAIGARAPFAYVTGRAAAWIERNVLPVLDEAIVGSRLQPVHPLVCAELGAITLHRLADGTWAKRHRASFRALADLRIKVRPLVERIPGVFFDTEKEVMISAEADHALRQSDPHVIEAGLQEADRLFRDLAAERRSVEVHRTTYACDLVPRGLSKSFGARRVLEERQGKPSFVHLLGDSLSDLALADPCKEWGIPYQFYFVGDKQLLTEKHRRNYVLAVPTKPYDEGTIEILQQF